MPEQAESLLLAWDTCTDFGVITLSDGERSLGSARFKTVKGHAGWLLPLIDSTVRAADRSPRDIGVLAVGTGPGGYTGVKVGVSTAKAMALGLGVPLVGVPTLDLLAAHGEEGSGPVLACLDAKQGLVYTAGYSSGGEDARRLTEYRCVMPREAGRIAATLGSPEVTIVGFAEAGLVEAARNATAEVAVDEARGFPEGDTLARLAARMLRDGLAGDALSTVPVYLKKPV
jgi:tRNA threonylcarbamoyladenosine biosynthesis protein TsaB